MDWNDVRHFLALARLRSVRAAGASLGVSHSTIARRVLGSHGDRTRRVTARGGPLIGSAGQSFIGLFAVAH